MLGENGARTIEAALLAVLVSLGVGCSDPDAIGLELAPEVISSQEGTLHARAQVFDGRLLQSDEGVVFSVAYIDRNGVEHEIAAVEGNTGNQGDFEAIFEGFDWEGAGTVTATLVGDDSVSATATFSVLDRTPPAVTILPPTEDLRVGAGFPLEVAVQVSDEIGVSEVFLEASGDLDRSSSTLVASGSTEATVRFDFDIPNDARSGPTITLHAMAADLSGNLSAAEPVVLTVDPTIVLATTEGLTGTVLGEGNNNLLDQPSAIAVSPKNGAIYVADSSGGACDDGCVWRVDPSTGTPVAAPVFTAGGNQVTGLAFDATGDTLYVAVPQDELHTLTYNVGNDAYESAALCAGSPGQDPMHLIVDASNGILLAESNDKEVKDMAAVCDQNAGDFTDFGGALDRPWGIAVGQSGEYYVSDEGNDRVYQVASDGASFSLFEDRSMDEPRGLAWLVGGTTAYADSLLVANYNRRTIESTAGPDTARAAIYLRNRPVDIAFGGSVMYILTEPSGGDEGRVLAITGF